MIQFTVEHTVKNIMDCKTSYTGIKLQMLKTTSDARILAGEATISTIENAMKILENLGRQKGYEQRS